MKIKTWLLLTYLLVMLLPLAGGYGLYLSITAYYQDKNVGEYFEKWSVMMDLKDTLSNPLLYQNESNYEAIEMLTSNQLMITLYAPNGRIFYSSNPLTMATGNFETREAVFKDLYDFQQNYQTYVYKEPVYKNGEMIGIYKITSLRTEWMEQVNNKATLVAVSLLIFLCLLYVAVLYFLNRRLNVPMKMLMKQMSAFAKGEVTEPLPIRNDELGELTASFHLMQQEIETTREKLNEEQRQKEFMIASLSHDLKTPLTSIQAYAESLRTGKLSEQEQQEYLEVITTKSEYMKQLLEDLMMYTLLESPSYELELVSVDGDEFFEMLLSDYDQINKEKGFTTNIALHVNGHYAVNPKQLMRVVDNLVANAWTYTPPGGEVNIGAFESPYIPTWCNGVMQVAENEQAGVYIIFQNSGGMLSKEQCQRMFDPLYQIDQSRSNIGQRGAGLGLSIARQIIEKHHGTIQAVSTNNHTAIICWLPKENEK